MVEKTPFQKFIELIDFDQRIALLEQQRDQVTHELSALENQEIQFSKQIDVLRRVVIEAQKSVDGKELEMKALEQSDQEKKERLKATSGQKEYKSLKIEIERVHHKQHALEQELVGAWKQLESAQKAYDEKVKTVDQAVHDVRAAVQEKKAMIDQLTATIAESVKDRPARQESVPSEWLEKYKMMRSQVTDPVVPVHEGNCSSCFYKVTDNDMQQLRRNKLMQCKDCYRFLYIKSPDDAGIE